MQIKEETLLKKISKPNSNLNFWFSSYLNLKMSHPPPDYGI